MRSLHEGRSIPAHPDSVRMGLSEARELREQAERNRKAALEEAARWGSERAGAMLDLGAWLIAGHELRDQIPFREFIELAGLSSRTAYALMREHNYDPAADGNHGTAEPSEDDPA